MKINLYIPVLVATTLFSGVALAGNSNVGDPAAEDILHGKGSVSASPSTPYLGQDRRPNGTETDVLSNLQEINGPGQITPYVRTEGDRDNNNDLIDNLS